MRKCSSRSWSASSIRLRSVMSRKFETTARTSGLWSWLVETISIQRHEPSLCRTRVSTVLRAAGLPNDVGVVPHRLVAVVGMDGLEGVELGELLRRVAKNPADGGADVGDPPVGPEKCDGVEAMLDQGAESILVGRCSHASSDFHLPEVGVQSARGRRRVWNPCWDEFSTVFGDALRSTFHSLQDWPAFRN